LDYTRDTDPVETEEWLDSLVGVIEVDGPERAHL
jgi:pyruvate dehydrogenase E1 component